MTEKNQFECSHQSSGNSFRLDSAPAIQIRLRSASAKSCPGGGLASPSFPHSTANLSDWSIIEVAFISCANVKVDSAASPLESHDVFGVPVSSDPVESPA